MDKEVDRAWYLWLQRDPLMLLINLGYRIVVISSNNSLSPGMCGSYFQINFVKWYLSASCKIVVWWMPGNDSDRGNGLVPSCNYSSSHYLNHCRPRSMSPYRVIRAYWDKVQNRWKTLQWRHNEHKGISTHQSHDCLFNRLFKAQIKENTKAPRYWPLCGEFTGDRWILHTKDQ